MKISILIYSLASGGAERVVSILLKELCSRYDITLVLMNNTIFYDIPDNVEVVYLENSDPNESGIKKLLKLPALGWKYRQLLRKKGIELSLSFMIRPNYINILAKLFGSNAKTLISERSMFSLQFSYKNLQSFINKRLVKLYNFADLIVANSNGNREDLKRNFNIKPEIKTIYNALDISQIEKRKEEDLEIAKERFTFVTIGRMDVGKNHLLLIEAVKGVDADLWIMGDGELREELEVRIEDLELKNRVKLLGRKNNPYKFLNRADSFVFGSNHEGFPNVLLEALACGLPVISTDCKSGPREILAPKSDFTKQAREIEFADFGVLVPVGDADKMARAMRMMVEDESLRESLKEKAFIRARDFKVDKIIDQWVSVIDGY
jgi:N-acetylgalactosamine-N,N'-diacetylbacillosaminyl-diphospho-undecaprenol 4-alpha-N-acetylgalactosaminyltransferase